MADAVEQRGKKPAGFHTLVRFLPMLWPKGETELKARVIAAVVLVLTGKAATLVMPFAYKAVIDRMSGASVAFGVVAMLETTERPFDKVSDYAGLWNERAGLAALMTLFLLSLGGFPPFAGFIAKWYVFSAAVRAGENWLAIVGVLSSVVSVFFYLRIVVMMYMTSADAEPRVPPDPGMAAAALVVSAAAVLYLGVMPARVMDWAARSMGTIF